MVVLVIIIIILFWILDVHIFDAQYQVIMFVLTPSPCRLVLVWGV